MRRELVPLPSCERERLQRCAKVIGKAYRAERRRPWLWVGAVGSLVVWVWCMFLAPLELLGFAESIRTLAFLALLIFGAWAFDCRDSTKAAERLKPELDELKARGLFLGLDGRTVSRKLSVATWSVDLDPLDPDAYDDVVRRPERFARN